jgi:putative cardiolipin synthase
MRSIIDIAMKKIFKLLRTVILCYLVYALVGGVLVFAFSPQVSEGSHGSSPPLRGNDGVALLDGRLESFDVRIHLLQHATEYIDIAYHTVHPGDASDIFFGEVLSAADRGVQVRLLLDGLFHNLRFSMRGAYHALIQHPNIELRYWEPVNPIKPWTWQHRLHDKMVLVDGKYVIIGGRNIGDKYYFEREQYKPVFDLDVMIRGDADSPASFFHAAHSYFEKLWQSPYAEPQEPSRITERKAVEATNTYVEAARMYETSSALPSFVPVEMIHLVHNPLDRGSKNPAVLSAMRDYSNSARERIVIQSPYIIINGAMRKYAADTGEAELLFLTNSQAVSPNYFAMSGYLNNRKRLLRSSDILEYQGPGSLHGKTILIDGKILGIGTFNMDPRSSFLSTETMVFIESENLATQLEEILGTYMESSLPPSSTQHVPFMKWITTSLVRLIVAPFHYML